MGFKDCYMFTCIFSHTRKNGCQFLILNNTGLISKYSNFIQTVLNKMQIKINKLDEGNVVEMSLPHHKVNIILFYSCNFRISIHNQEIITKTSSVLIKQYLCLILGTKNLSIVTDNVQFL